MLVTALKVESQTSTCFPSHSKYASAVWLLPHIVDSKVANEHNKIRGDLGDINIRVRIDAVGDAECGMRNQTYALHGVVDDTSYHFALLNLYARGVILFQPFWLT